MSAPARLGYESFEAGGAREWLMRIGSDEAPAILFLPALFEEMNRTRALTAAIMRRLAAVGFRCWLPDLPGTGESPRALDQCSWEDWRQAIDKAAQHLSGRLRAVATIRGGCLLDQHLQVPRWRFAPVGGAALVRDLNRAGLMGGGGSAGYAPSAELLAALEAAEATPNDATRVVRLASDRGEADHKVTGPALWRRSEPASSAELAAQLAADLGEWARSCAGS